MSGGSANAMAEGKASEMARIGDGMMRAGPLRDLPELIRGFGVRYEPLLDAVGLPRNALAGSENVVRIDQAGELLALAARRCNCPHLGLLIGQRFTPAHLGLVGLQMMHATSLGAAFRSLILTLHLNGRALVPALVVRDNSALLSFSVYGAQEQFYSHLLDLALAAACSVMRILSGVAWSPVEVQFAHRPPADARPYRRFFKAPLVFGSGKSGLLFPASWLGRKVRGASAATRRDLQHTIGDLLARQDLDLLSRVRRAVFAALNQEDDSIDGTAALLGMHKRTLNRRLAEHDTSFAKLLGEVRFQLACQLLLQTDLPLVDVAATLNYTDASTFSRAFSSWAHMPPSAWRASHLSR